MIFVVLSALGVAGGNAYADSANKLAGTEPAGNAVLRTAPQQIAIYVSSATASSAGYPSGSSATVYGTEHTAVAGGALTRSVDDAHRLVLAVPHLGAGVYTVVWSHAGDTGSFAFAIDPSGASPVTVTHPTPRFTLPGWGKVLVQWVSWVTEMVFVGVLMLRFLVSAPTARRLGHIHDAAAVLAGTDRRLLRVATVALLLFVPATITQVAFEAGKGSFAYTRIWATVTADGHGHLWLVRLAVTILAARLMLPMAIRPERCCGPRLAPVMLAGLVLGLLELFARVVARVVPLARPVNVSQILFGTAMGVGHLSGAAVWIGGLAGLTALAVAQTVPARQRRQFWPEVIRRFSMVAMTCVAALSLSGLWLYWKQVDGLSQLISTLYGRTLLVKLILFGALLLLGGFHQFWLLPRLRSAPATGDDRSFMKIISRHFRVVVAIEVVLGVGVLFVVPMLSNSSPLSSSSRNQEFQAKAADLTRTATADGAQVSLTPSGLQPGLTDYDVAVSGQDAGRVTLSFASTQLGVPGHDVVATAVGGGHYRVSGFHTPMVGDWQVRVAIDENPHQASFTLPVKAKAPTLAKPPPPAVRASTWASGLAGLVAVLVALLGAVRVSRYLTARRSPKEITVAADGDAGPSGDADERTEESGSAQNAVSPIEPPVRP